MSKPATPGSELTDSKSPGDRVAHYSILSTIGQGGTGIVYRARDDSLGRDVALKCLRVEALADPDSRRRFLREPKAASRIHHPNVIAIHEVFESDGIPWIAMELVDGPSLRSLLKEGAIPPNQVVRWGEELARALEAAHEKHVVHRDVNPNNILIQSDGRAVLGDFGIAGYFTPPGAPGGTHTPSSITEGALVGTAQYLSPEQALGRSVDGRSDLFSLGAVLYEMCTGKLAFPANEFSRLLDDILHHEPEPITNRTWAAPVGLDVIIRKLLRKDPDERYATAGDVAIDLGVVRRELERGALPARRDPRRALFVWLALPAAAILLLAGWLLRDRLAVGDRPLPTVHPTRLTAEAGPESDPALSPDGTEVAFTGERNGNDDIWVVDAGGGEADPLTDDPGADRSPAWFPDGRQVAFVSDRGGNPGIWRVGRRGGAATLILANAVDPAISPDGLRIAFVRNRPEQFTRIAVCPLADTSRVVFLTTDHDGLWNHHAPTWSPDGRTIAYDAPDGLRLVPAAGGTPILLNGSHATDTHPVFSADGRFLYFGSKRDGTTSLWRLRRDGSRPLRLTLGTGFERQPSLGSNRTRLAYATSIANENLVIVDRATGRSTPIHDESADFFPAIAPDGGRLVYASNRWGKQDLWSRRLVDGVPAGEPVRLTDHPGGAAHPVYSADGAWIAYYRIVEGKRDIWILPAEGGEPNQITDDAAPDYHPTLAPDGRRLAWISQRGDGRPRLWTMPLRDGRPAGEADSLLGSAGDYLSPTFSPDGSRIAVLERSAVVVIVPASGGGAPARIPVAGQLFRLRWDGDGSHLIVAGDFGDHQIRLRRISSINGAIDPGFTMPPLGSATDLPEFDLTPDGRCLVLTATERRGDIWLLSADTGEF